jgi:hypothetical protein
VLLIDGSSDTEEVLRAVLEPRGTVVSRTRSHGTSSAMDGAAPDVVVMDLDERSQATPVRWSGTRQVLLGSTRVTITEPGVRFLEKPFHFPDLVKVVEDFLTTPRAA